MSHELEIQQGVASMLFVGETPWHGLGAKLDTAPSYAEALEVGRLDYEVEKRPLYRKVGDDEFVQSKSGFCTVRTDRGRELGVVGKDYKVVQNRDAFGILEPLIDERLALIETGGVLRDGADAWLLVRWNLEQFPAIVREQFTDEVVPFSLVVTNHIGRKGVVLRNTPIRVVCRNTLSASEGTGKELSIRHSKNANVRLVDAAHKMWGTMVERTERLAEAFSLLKARRLDDVLFEELVIKATVQDPRLSPKWDRTSPRAEASIRQYEYVTNRIRKLWTAGQGHTGNKSAWEAYNGLVEVMDHDTDAFRAHTAESRLASLTDGTLARTKQRVFDNLLGVA